MNAPAMTPARAAHRLTHVLDTFAAAHTVARFPVDVQQLALGAADLFNWKDPITQVEPADIRGFEGALFPSDGRTSWILLYNHALRSRGRIRFTKAHELAHYILHRSLRESFECSAQDMLNWSGEDTDLESQADEFASHLLMPLNDYRRQVDAQVDFDLMGHCAERYGVSLTAAILKWLSYTDEKAIIIMSTDGYMNWASASTPAMKAGAFFRTRTQTIQIPQGSITANTSIQSERKGVNVPAAVWFPHAEPQVCLREMKLQSEHYECVITLLILPRVATVWPPRAEEDFKS
jgi:hypothetical protein